MINEQEIVQNIKDLVSIPSPSGFTGDAISYVSDFLKKENVPFYLNHKGD